MSWSIVEFEYRAMIDINNIMIALLCIALWVIGIYFGWSIIRAGNPPKDE